MADRLRTACDIAIDMLHAPLYADGDTDIAAVALEPDGLLTQLISLLGGEVPAQLAAESRQ